MKTEHLESTRRSWNAATRLHNAHKGDQAAFFRAGGDVLFAEELELLGALGGQRLVHLQCNAGQDSLGLARRGAEVLGVDLSDEAIDFARKLSVDAGIPARFECAEVVRWLQTTDERFDLAFSSYGATGWLEDLGAWARGVQRVLVPGGRFVYVEFHPLVWSYEKHDDYFATAPFIEPVSDYVGESGASLGASAASTPGTNEIPAYSWQHPVGEVVSALAGAGLQVQTLREYPHSNGFKPVSTLVAAEGRRWVWPEGAARMPLMYAVTAQRSR